ncbi:hypothetical protein GJU41_19550 [Bacillus idriensis]|uniref:Uncharacterized protein n=1 Tax=Metabacillus idriensis TaxID=324768 RepID=A0A6I2MG73_9BACI|nr:hypothetical protein [Metabacillus idriensis]MRX56157.1 hypothetical protein [Metabacillus idriensis]
MKLEIENTFQNIIGFPLNGSSRSLDMAKFNFGKLIQGFDKWGNVTIEAEYSLHVQCSWRLSNQNKIITASKDIYIPRSDIDFEDDDFEWEEEGMNRFDELIESFLAEKKSKIYVSDTTADNLGGIKVFFSDGTVLEIFPDESTEDEFWRLFKPGKLDSHFVVTGLGIEKDC